MELVGGNGRMTRHGKARKRKTEWRKGKVDGPLWVHQMPRSTGVICCQSHHVTVAMDNNAIT